MTTTEPTRAATERPARDNHADTLAVMAAMSDMDHPAKTTMCEWAAATFADDDIVARDDASEFTVDGWRACAAHGVLGLRVDPRWGGQGLGLADTLLSLEGLGKGCTDNGLTFAIASQIWTIQGALERFGSDAQRDRWLPGLVSGDLLGAFAITEPASGSDSYAAATTATPTDAGTWRLQGSKAHITMGPLADVVLVFASTRPDAGRWGLSAFLVPTDAPGVTRHPNRAKMGMRTTPFGGIDFDDVEVDESALIGRPGAGASIFAAAVESERAYLFATTIGAMERQLELTALRARTRTQFDRPIGDFQSVSNRIADMRVRHETARLLLYKAALLEVTGRPVTDVAAMAKLVISEASVASGIDATTVHGAVGYICDEGIERDLRDAVGGLTYSGTSDIQRTIISRYLGVGK